MVLLYNLILLFFSPLLVLLYLPVFLLKKKHRENFFLRMKGPRESGGLVGRGELKIWIHAVSVGEVLAAISLIKGIKKVSPEAKIYFSTITVTGQSVAQAKARDLVVSIFYLPFDIFPLISKVVSDISPHLLVIMETEIWPNLIVSAKKRGVCVAIANGRISDKSFPRYRPFRFFFKNILERVDLFLMQSNLDRDRILALGAPPDRVKVTKNLKYDIDKVDTEHLLKLKETIRREAAGRKIIVAGSTHEGEEMIIINALSDYAGTVYIVLAPRHPERFDKVAETMGNSNMRYVLRSTLNGLAEADPGGTDICILDSMGELSGLYAIADIVIMGGSFVAVGGHNVLEPALYGIPVITGSYYFNFKDIIEELHSVGGVLIVSGARELGDEVRRLLQNPGFARNIGERACDLVANYRGLGEKVASELLRYVG